MAGLLAILADRAGASAIIDLFQNGVNVTATGSGSLDLTDLVGPSSNLSFPQLDPSVGGLILGPASDTSEHLLWNIRPVSYWIGDER